MTRPPPTLSRGGRAVIDTDRYIPYFLAAVNNALSRSASAQYRRAFGLGIGEWRVISMLAIEPGIPAARICEVISLDKAAVSRSLNRLDHMGYLVATPSPSDPRRRAWSLNPAGLALHDRILETALAREEQLIQGTDPADLQTFLRVMRQMRRNVRNM